MNKRTAGVEINGAFELLLCAGEVPVVIHFEDRQGIVSFAESIIELQCLPGSFFRLRHPFTGEREKGHFGVSVGQSSVSRCVLRVDGDGAIKTFNGFLETVWSKPAEV